MKTQNNNENKARFFALYIGSALGDRKSFTDSQELTVSNFASVVRFSNAPLSLRPLSDITDEEISELLPQLVDDWEDALGDAGVSVREFTEAMTDGLNSEENLEGMNTAQAINTFDYLRSHSFALPWMDLSVNDLVEYGWVKLREL